MEINDIRCHEEEVVAIGEIPGGCIAMVSSDNMMERHGESQIHLNFVQESLKSFSMLA